VSNHRTVVVLVEDDPQIRRFVSMALNAENCDVHEADTVKQGLIESGTRKPDLVILDLGLPDRDGIEFIRDLRSWSQLPILVLSARTHEQDKVHALDAGADDYLTKPFGVAELLARVRAILRRQMRLSDNVVQSKITFGNLTIDMELRTVEREGEILHLTPIEYRLLSYLVANTGKVLTHRQLLRDVWGPSQIENTPSLRVFMAHLRQKIEDDPSQPKYLLTETGVGYRFVL
jgi:two-component system, OmpR family, KDP operon response regulator KdpE